MNNVHNLLNTDTLFLTWQSHNNHNLRYCVGTLRKVCNEKIEFTYNIGTEQFAEAESEGFVGYPAFKISEQVYDNDVLSTFFKRMPPRSRKDFTKYLLNHHLDSNFNGDDYQLLSHTGIQLPSDGFDIIPDLSKADIPFDYMMEVAGTRHNITFAEFESIDIRTPITFVFEPTNSWDKDAISIYCGDMKVGYVNRLLCCSLKKLLADRTIESFVAKKSGTQDRPILHVLLRVK